MMDEYHIKRVEDRDGKSAFWISGLDIGPNPIRILDETKSFILAYRKGYRGWCARGETCYYNPEYIIYEKVDQENVYGIFGVWHESYTRATRKQTLAQAKERFENLKIGKGLIVLGPNLHPKGRSL